MNVDYFLLLKECARFTEFNIHFCGYYERILGTLRERIALLFSFVFWFSFSEIFGESIYASVRSCWIFLNLFFPLPFP